MGLVYLADGVMLFVCLLSWFKGGPAERSGALLLFLTWIGSDLARRAIAHWGVGDPEQAKATLSLLGDSLLALGLLVLAIRYSSLWLGSVLLIQGGTMTLHSVFMDKASTTLVYIYLANLFSYGFLLMMLAGALASWRHRSVRTRAAASAQRPPPIALLVPGPTLSHAA